MSLAVNFLKEMRPNMETVFISYSHKDDKRKDEIMTHLKVLEKQGNLTLWNDEVIQTGADWFHEIKTNLETASVVIMVVTANFLGSDFILNEEVPRILERRGSDGFLIVPLIAEPCPWKAVEWLKKMQLFPKDGTPLSKLDKPERDEALADLSIKVDKFLAEHDFGPKTGHSTGVEVSTSQMPLTGEKFIGRERELAFLDAAWVDGKTRIVTLVAWGGAGKTSLINKWLNLMQENHYGGARRVYAWSFYSQGAEEGKQASADEFLHETLAWFGDRDTAAGSMVDKGRRLARLVDEHKTLLILDGLEPLQYPPGEAHGNDGKLKDQGMAAFLKQLAAACPGDDRGCGLCVITSRAGVTDLANKTGHAVKEMKLDRLPEEAGVELLKELGVTTGSAEDMKKAVKEYDGHALALTLLGNYIVNHYKGDIRKRDKIPKLTGERFRGEHAWRVMAAYEKGFKEKSETNSNDQNSNDRNKNKKSGASDLSPELSILYIMGLFDRPVEPGVIGALTAVSGIFEGISEAEWEEALSTLRGARLLDRENPGKPGTLDCHPLVREYFGESLRRRSPDRWHEAHERLYRYFKELPKKEFPDTLEEMGPLFAAVFHGCKAGLHREALDEVYYKRIQRDGETNYCCKHLGAFGADLSAVSHFFDEPWSRPAAGLTEEDQALVLSWAAFRLRAVGRLREASQTMIATLKRYEEMDDPREIAIAASNLSELMLTLGEVDEAVEYGRRSVTHADRSGDAFEMESDRTTLADALHQSGEWAEAEKWFREAEELQKKRQPEYPFLYSLQGYQFCDLLLEHPAPGTDNGYDEVTARAEKTLEWARQGGLSLLAIALDHLTLGRASMAALKPPGNDRTGEGANTRFAPTKDSRSDVGANLVFARNLVPEPLTNAREFLDLAVTGLRESGYQYFLVIGLLARAECFRRMNSFDAARDDLEEAREIAELGDMKLFLCDYHLEAARLCAAEGDETGAAEHERRAEELIEETKYFRRKKKSKK
jgi:tetratricopeptide (TPR) repeat protein